MYNWGPNNLASPLYSETSIGKEEHITGTLSSEHMATKTLELLQPGYRNFGVLTRWIQYDWSPNNLASPLTLLLLVANLANTK